MKTNLPIKHRCFECGVTHSFAKDEDPKTEICEGCGDEFCVDGCYEMHQEKLKWENRITL